MHLEQSITDFRSLLGYMERAALSGKPQLFFEAFVMLIFQIWKARNQIVHGEVAMPALTMVEYVLRSDYENWGTTGFAQCSGLSWPPPSP